MYVASVLLRVRPSKRPETLSAIRQLMRSMRAWPQCAACRFLAAADDDNSLLLISEWKSRDALDQLLTSQEFQVLRGMRMLLQQDPQMIIDEVGSRRMVLLDGP
jgi:quinol monooxygenase YgiN